MSALEKGEAPIEAPGETSDQNGSKYRTFVLKSEKPYREVGPHAG